MSKPTLCACGARHRIMCCGPIDTLGNSRRGGGYARECRRCGDRWDDVHWSYGHDHRPAPLIERIAGWLNRALTPKEAA